MKTSPYVSQLSLCGGFAAVFTSLLPCAGNPAQDVQTKPPQAATATGSLTSSVAACSADRAFYAVATPDGRNRSGSTRDVARARTLLHCNPRAIQFSTDSRFLAVASDATKCPGKIKIWQVADGALICKLDNKSGSDPLLSFSPDGLLLVSTGKVSRINLWQLPWHHCAAQ